MKALLVIDFINEIVSDEGKLSKKGYSDFIQKNDTFTHLNTAIEAFRKNGYPVIFINLEFLSGYPNQPKKSPVFGKAEEFGILLKNTWSTEITKCIKNSEADVVITKDRVSAFHNTELENHLRNLDVEEIYISAVATDLAGEATARSGHDLDFQVVMVANACAAANHDDHEKTLNFMKKIGSFVDAEDLKFE